jgi:hypothetical protein
MPEQGEHVPPGKDVFGFLCANSLCGLPIVIGEILPHMLDANGSLTIRGSDQELTCPSCGHEFVYPIQQATRFQAVEKAKLS